MANQKRSELFDQVAELYNLARPGYPDRLIHDVITITNLTDSANILEIGAGTGKATVPFAQRDYTIHCLEPGKNLAAVACENLRSFAKVSVETVKFEDWQLKESKFDLVISAQAFHWIPAEIGYPKAAKALKENGYLVVFWNFAPTCDSEVYQKLIEVYRTYAPSMSWRWKQTPIEVLMQKRENKMLKSGYFKNPKSKSYPWSIQYDVRQYLNLLNTQTDYLQLPQSDRQNLQRAIVEVLNAYGGSIVKPYVSALFIAQKA
jgi:protein-L-isoaspartate O-methyltransferase